MIIPSKDVVIFPGRSANLCRASCSASSRIETEEAANLLNAGWLKGANWKKGQSGYCVIRTAASCRIIRRMRVRRSRKFTSVPSFAIFPNEVRRSFNAACSSSIQGKMHFISSGGGSKTRDKIRGTEMKVMKLLTQDISRYEIRLLFSTVK